MTTDLLAGETGGALVVSAGFFAFGSGCFAEAFLGGVFLVGTTFTGVALTFTGSGFFTFAAGFVFSFLADTGTFLGARDTLTDGGLRAGLGGDFFDFADALVFGLDFVARAVFFFDDLATWTPNSFHPAYVFAVFAPQRLVRRGEMTRKDIANT